MADDWDLHAVVRGCAAVTTTSTSTSATASLTNTTSNGRAFSTFQQADCSFSTSFKDLFEPRRERLVQELHELYRPFYPMSEESSSQTVLSSQILPISPLSVLGGLQDLPSEQQQLQQHQQQHHLQIMKQLPQPTHLRPNQRPFSVANSSSKASVSHAPPPRSKRRKNNLKRVCHVAAENLSTDMWSWRKYGQKPIKGSPYPRGYYRCSTSKGCMARKQVERNRSDPGMFIVTYTAEHNHPMPPHRNSLAGSTRQKQPETPNSDDPSKPSSSSPEISPATEKMESSRDELEEEDDFSISEMALDEDFFAGLEDITATDDGDCLDGHFPVKLPWFSNSSAAATITGGG